MSLQHAIEIWQVIPVGILCAFFGAVTAWYRMKRGLNRKLTTELYQQFYSSEFSDVRNKARYFILYYAKHKDRTCEYFIYLDIRFSSRNERDEYYTTITNFTHILYFFSGLVEFYRLGMVDKANLRRQFLHVFEWWYLAVIRDFIASYDRVYTQAINDHTSTRRKLISRPPWVANIKQLIRLMHDQTSR